MEKKLPSDKELKTEEKMEKKSDSNSAAPPLFLLTNEMGIRGIWDKMFASGYLVHIFLNF